MTRSGRGWFWNGFCGFFGCVDLTWCVFRWWEVDRVLKAFVVCPRGLPFGFAILWRAPKPPGGYSRKGGE